MAVLDILRSDADLGGAKYLQLTARSGAILIGEAARHIALPEKLLPLLDPSLDHIAMPVFFGCAIAIESVDEAEQRRLTPTVQGAADRIEQGLLIRAHGVVELDAIGEQMNAKRGSREIVPFDGGFEMIEGEFQFTSRRKQRAAPRLKIPLPQFSEQPAAHERARRVAEQMDF